ncbi:MAG: RES family NAD+ phosphorylase [Deltaproteobacteria bacterium]|nr:RES family NAD+ phosphorylase [Deltaproteobacteria bacterium]
MHQTDTDFFESPTDWYQFCRYIEAKNRYVLTPRWEKFINAVVQTAQKRVQVLKKDVRLARARIGVKEIEDEKYDWLIDFRPLPPEEMGAPPSLAATDGRVNPHGISYLYLANSVETAIAEARPWVGAEVSVGYFRLLKDQKLINTSEDKKIVFLPVLGKQYSAQEKEEGVWGDINEFFSRPVSPQESSRHYVPTQYLGEVFKTNGFDGALYKSSLNGNGYNVVLFDPGAAELFKCSMFRVEGVDYKFSESGNPYFNTKKT